MKYSALVMGLVLVAGVAHADGKPLAARVGVDEHVGDRVPGDMHVTDEHGRSFQISDFASDGKPTVLSLAYYHCPGLCDISLRELATTLRASGWKLGQDYRALTVSIDPHDTPTSAGAKRANVLQLMHVQDNTLWPFTVTDQATLQRLTQALGYRYDYDAPTHQYAHPAVSIVLTPDAKVSRYLYGPTLDTRTVVLALREARLGRGGASALVDRTVLSCFQYDPVSRRYSVLILGVMRIGSALIALLLALFIFIYVRRADGCGVRLGEGSAMDYIRQILRLILFLPPESSTIADQVDWLHFSVIGLTMVGAFAIALISAVFCIRYRQPAWRRPGTARNGVPPSNIWAELALIGGLFALFVGWWGVGFWQYVEITAPPADTYDIYVSAKQWMWKFAYPDGSHTIDTLYVPAQRPVRLILTSRDVIHSFFVPDFRVKHDAVPGRYTTVWFTAKGPGTHHVFCAEYCGTWHSRMRAEVVALSEPDFAQWLRSGERERDFPLDPDLPVVGAGDSSLVARGEQVAAAYGCLRCHSVDGSPHIGPTFAGLYESKIPIEGGAETRADVAYITESMMDPNAKIHRGFPAVMPSYIGYLKPPEVGALVSYIKTLQTATTITAIAPAIDTKTYPAPDTTPTREPRPAGEIGEPPGQPKNTRELEAEPRGTGPMQSGSIESAPNPLPRGTPQQLQQQMLQRRDDAQNSRQP